MQNVFKLCVFFWLLMMSVVIPASPAVADPGLLLVAHGSPSPEWNGPVLEFGRRVAKEVEKRGRFKAVRTAMLEFAKPDVPTAVAELEAAGCDRIIAVPLFIAPSGHTHFDVPAVLGIYWSPKIAAVLAGEGAKAAQPKLPIVLTQTLSESDILDKYVLDQVRKLSKSPKDEALVLLAHGDPEHHLLIERLMRRIATYCCGEAGISFGDWASVGVGQKYAANGVPAIQNALEHRNRVLVVGVYVSITAAKIHQRSEKRVRGHGPASAPFREADVALSDELAINHPAFLQGVLEAA